KSFILLLPEVQRVIRQLKNVSLSNHADLDWVQSELTRIEKYYVVVPNVSDFFDRIVDVIHDPGYELKNNVELEDLLQRAGEYGQLLEALLARMDTVLQDQVLKVRLIQIRQLILDNHERNQWAQNMLLTTLAGIINVSQSVVVTSLVNQVWEKKRFDKKWDPNRTNITQRKAV
ncbi:MAG: hypothetical protein AABZ14_02765, partial [Candidatus Margulisiibacteriota bacterium]